MNVPETEVIVTIDGAELSRHVVRPGEYVIGREAVCDIVVEAKAVSRRHAKLTVNYNETFIEDLASSNGTFVAGAKISEYTRLFPSQTIQIGVTTIHLKRIKKESPEDALTPHSAAVKRYFPPDFLHDRKYEIGAMIAQGGMGSILEAQERLLRRKVAMKIMTSNGTQEELVRFIEEAQITSQLDHPNIVPVYELGVDEQEQVFYTMKLVRGDTLKKVLDRLRSGDRETLQEYSLAALLTIFQKVCDGLAFAHSKGVIHRDLKPDNVMLGEFGEVLVMDWGLARASATLQTAPGKDPRRSLVSSTRQDEGAAMMTLCGTVLGTPQYMAPEQARGETSALDARTDVYSLGSILYHILTLEPPISGEDVGEVLESVATGRVADHIARRGPRGVRHRHSLPHLPGGKIPEPLAALTRKAMEFSQADRFETVKEMQAALAALQEVAVAVAAVPAATSAPVAPRKKKLEPLVPALAAVILILLALSAKLALDRTRADAALHEAMKSAAKLARSRPRTAEAAEPRNLP